MIRKPFQEICLPALGLGCMRFPTDEGREIKRAEVAEMVAYAMANGVNYFDTGYDYHGGMSERVIGELLSTYERESFYLADKFPAYDPRNWRRVKTIFEEQLTRCRVDYFDFYLLHNVSEANIDALLNPRYGILDYLCEMRAAGKIRHLGFSAHGDLTTIERLLEAYGDVLEFAQIQLNYIDYHFQGAREKIELLTRYGLPIWVMEPLRGGRLIDPKLPYAARVASAFPELQPVETAFRFIASVPTVCVTLSGMSSLAQLKQNIALFREIQPLSAEEMDRLSTIAKAITADGTVPCTGCRYCTDHCPAKLDIPKLIGYYNEHTFSGGGFIVPTAVAALKRDQRPTACIGCRSCEGFCPQGIRISEVMADLCEKLNLR